MKKKLERNRKFLTKAEYAGYLEAMKRHGTDTPSASVSSGFMPEE